MSDQTSIEWTDATWNPVTGCQKISPGCKNCYAARLGAAPAGHGKSLDTATASEIKLHRMT